MNDHERALYDRAVALLRDLGNVAAINPPPPALPAPSTLPPASKVSCPISEFARTNLFPNPEQDVTTAELWSTFNEYAATCAVQHMGKAEFFLELPHVMRKLFGRRKSHQILRGSQRHRGFRAIGFKKPLREFECVVGKVFVSQSGMINLHGPHAALFRDGEALTFESPDTGRTFHTTAKHCGMLLSGAGSRTVNGFKGIALKTQPTPGVDRLVFKETKPGTFRVTVRKVDPEIAAATLNIYRKHKRNKDKLVHQLVDLGVIESITTNKS
jgi:hypothetical protein